MQQIHDLGVGIALDDFGTGYSSLSYLRCFPFNKVKIDRSFVMDLGRQSGADTITAAIIGLCVRLGLKITAEGVETEDQLERLANLHCTQTRRRVLHYQQLFGRGRLVIQFFRRGRQGWIIAPGNKEFGNIGEFGQVLGHRVRFTTHGGKVELSLGDEAEESAGPSQQPVNLRVKHLLGR